MEYLRRLHFINDVEIRHKIVIGRLFDKIDIEKFRRLSYNVDCYDEVYSRENNKSFCKKTDEETIEIKSFHLRTYDDYIDHFKLLFDKIKEKRELKREGLDKEYQKKEDELFSIMIRQYNRVINDANKLEREIRDFKEKNSQGKIVQSQ